MKITDVKINGLKNPMGYELSHLRVSWKVWESEGKHQVSARIEVSADEAFTDIFYVKEGEDLSSFGEELEIGLKPYTRYYVRVQVESDRGESALSDTACFETAKMGQPWIGRWITAREEDQFHPVFLKTFRPVGKVKEARL